MSRPSTHHHLHTEKRIPEDLPSVLVRSPRHPAARSRQHQHPHAASSGAASSAGDTVMDGSYSDSSANSTPHVHSAVIRTHHPVVHSSRHVPHGRWSTRHTVVAIINSLLALLMHQLLSVTGAKQAELFYIYYQPFAPFLIMLWLWGVNVMYFERHGVRYDVCFNPEDQKHLLPSTAIFDIANVLSMVVMGSACVFLFYCIQGLLDVAALQPPLIYFAMLVILLLPFTVLYQDTRRFFATTAWRVITPIRGVSWADFLLADILTSLAKGISDVERAVCLMASGSVMSPAADVCNDASWVIPAGLAMPYLWRLVQCLRVHSDTGAKPQLWNALKYCTAFPVIILSAVKYHVPLEDWRGFYKPLWLAAAMLNSGFSFFWDIERDWEISFFSQMRAKKTALVRPILQPALLYRKPFYLYLMISNALLRLSWTYKLSPHLRRNHTAVFFIVVAEAFRRFQWIFVRIEVELRKIQAARPEVGQLVPAQVPHSNGHAPLLGGEVQMKSKLSDVPVEDAL